MTGTRRPAPRPTVPPTGPPPPGNVRHAPGPLLLLAVLLVALLAGCTSSEEPRPEPAGETPTGRAGEPVDAVRAPPPPRVGSCYRLTLRQAARPTNRSAPIPCTKKHTSRTIFVGRLDTVVRGHSLGVDSDRAQRQLARTCPAQLAKFLGGDPESRALSRFQVIWFSPTLAQYDRGASWFRCDVIAFGKADRLMELPIGRRLRGVLDRPGALATYGLCGTARPGTKGFDRVACGLRHSWVAIGTIPIPGGPRYPGVDKVRSAGDKACADRVRAENGFPLEFSYGWEWPTRDQWAAGQRYGFCWAPTNLT